MIQTLVDVLCYQLKFENPFDKGQCYAVKLCEAIAKDPNFRTGPVNEVLVFVHAHMYICNGCNMDMRDLPDMYA